MVVHIATLAMALAGGVEASPATSRPNILFILIDDMGWMDLGCQGNRHVRTPNIDRLAGEGVRFTDAYAPAPVCSPTRAALMTGHSPARAAPSRTRATAGTSTSSSDSS